MKRLFFLIATVATASESSAQPTVREGWKVELFAQADLLNAFGQDGVESPGFINTTITTSFESSNFAPFNRFSEVPVECPSGMSGASCKAMGAHFQKSAEFGQPAFSSAYQLARTYRFSAGLRF